MEIASKYCGCNLLLCCGGLILAHLAFLFLFDGGSDFWLPSTTNGNDANDLDYRDY